MKKLLITGIALIALSACATGPRPMMANGERCKEPYRSITGVWMTCDLQKRDAYLAESSRKQREMIKRARARIEKQNKEYRESMDPVECDQIIISSSGEELCVIQQD